METLIVITNLGRVRAMKFIEKGDDPQEQDHLVEQFDENVGEVGKPIRETVTDQSGRFGRHGMVGLDPGMSAGEEHNLESEMERKALERVSARVAGFLESEGCPPWLLVAPQGILGRLKNALPGGCQETLSDTVAADLTKLPLAKIEKRFLSRRRGTL